MIEKTRVNKLKINPSKFNTFIRIWSFIWNNGHGNRNGMLEWCLIFCRILCKCVFMQSESGFSFGIFLQVLRQTHTGSFAPKRKRSHPETVEFLSFIRKNVAIEIFGFKTTIYWKDNTFGIQRTTSTRFVENQIRFFMTVKFFFIMFYLFD